MVTVSFYNENPMLIDLPNQVTCKIESTDVALKGQTVSSSYKPATLSNGLKIQVPPFIENGDEIILDGEKGIIKLLVPNDELKMRKQKMKTKENDFTSGALWKFSQSVGSARYGAITHPGAKKEKKIYSDI